ncbi:MAG: hypothetical protein AAGN66_01945 [Acidobacteriota bacterium]
MSSNPQVELPVGPEEALDHVAQATEVWAGDWQSTADTEGEIGLPVMAGLRRGWVEGRIEAQAVGRERTRLTFFEERSDYRLDRAAVAMLVLALGGALSTVVAPFVRALWPLVPVGIVVALASWFFVIARLRNSGPEEFFKLLEDENRLADEREG